MKATRPINAKTENAASHIRFYSQGGAINIELQHKYL